MNKQRIGKCLAGLAQGHDGAVVDHIVRNDVKRDGCTGFKRKRRRQGGFTLIELMIAIAIIAILAAVAIPAICEYIKKKREAEAAAPPPIPISTAANWKDNDLREELQVVCIDGFEYYVASIVSSGESSDKSRAVLAPKFDKESALPKRCTAEQEKKP